MRVKELIELLQRCPQNDIVLAEYDTFVESASVEDVLIGRGTVKGFCYVKLEADEWELEIDNINDRIRSGKYKSVKYGRWERRMANIYVCSVCTNEVTDRQSQSYSFCPYCGALNRHRR